MLGEGGLRLKKSKHKHLLFALYFLKICSREGPRCSTVGGSKGAIDPKTMRKWVWLFLKCIAKLADCVVSLYVPLHPLRYHLTLLHCPSSKKTPQIDFKSLLVNDIGNNCLMMINGSNFRIQQKGVARKGNLFGSHKYVGKSVLRHELGADILGGNLVWVERPYPAGARGPTSKFLTLFYRTVLSRASVSRLTMATWGTPNRSSANNDCNPAKNLGMQSAARSCHGMLNACLTNWGILEKVYCIDIMAHRTVFYPCVVITQLAIVNEEPLFKVEYGDE